MLIILLFFLCHWYLAIFSQTFLQHRYASHAAFSMSKFWERFFYLLAYFGQGSSYVSPRVYAIMHRMHHAFSDTDKDPHSPYFVKDVWGLMMKTKEIYRQYAVFKAEPDPQFRDRYPSWDLIDRIGDFWPVRIAFGTAYTLFYIHFVPTHAWYLFLLLPIHYLMGPVHGAIVNWCGHKYGYANYDNHDHSKNTFAVDLLMGGELFQNNHHKSPNNPNFAQKWFEWDPSWPVIRLMNWFGIIHLRKQPA